MPDKKSIPYFNGQKPGGPCGCFYPDVTRVRDEYYKGKPMRVLLCIHHGTSRVVIDSTAFSKNEAGIPTEAWRETERARLKATK